MSKLSGLINRLRKEAAEGITSENLPSTTVVLPTPDVPEINPLNTSNIHAQEEIIDKTEPQKIGEPVSGVKIAELVDGPDSPSGRQIRNQNRKQRQKSRKRQIQDLSLVNLPLLSNDLQETVNELKASKQHVSTPLISQLKGLLTQLEDGSLEVEGLLPDTRQLARTLNEMLPEDSESDGSVSSTSHAHTSPSIQLQPAIIALSKPLEDITNLKEQFPAVQAMETDEILTSSSQILSTKHTVEPTPTTTENKSLVDSNTVEMEKELMEQNIPQEEEKTPIECYVPPFADYNWKQTSTWFTKSNDNKEPCNFLKGAKWSPNGDRIATCSEDSRIRVYHYPTDSSHINSDGELYDGGTVKLGNAEEVYDWAWYPHSSLQIEGSSLIATSCRETPIQLWDATNGSLRASYRSYNNLDNITAASSLGFTIFTGKLVAGFKQVIRVFDISRAGRDYQEYSTIKSTRARNGNVLREIVPGMELAGMISCLAFQPGASKLFAAGSFNKKIVIYNEDNVSPVISLEPMEGGVTQMQFTMDGSMLVSAGRRDPYIYFWDLRNTRQYLTKLTRVAKNGQKIFFDIDPTGSYLGTSSQDGEIKMWDLKKSIIAPFSNPVAHQNTHQTQEESENQSDKPNEHPIEHQEMAVDAVKEPELIETNLPKYRDAINSFQFNPSAPYWAITTGQRRFNIDWEAYSSDDKTSMEIVSKKSKFEPKNELVVGTVPSS